MAEVDERIVSMGFDNQQFERGAAQSISTLDKLKRALNFDKQENAFNKLEKTANSINFAGLQESLNQIQYWVSPIGNHISSVFDRAMSYVESRVMKTWNAIFNEAPTEGFKEYELKMGSVQTIMASTGETLETVNEYLDELNLYADKTIYSFSDMTSNIGKFTNAGVKLKDAVAAIQGVSNVAAVSGANANEASRAMYNFAQALSSGAVKLIDWKSIENANMATVEFKQQLLDTALALGTVVKEGNKYKSTTIDNNNKVSDLFNTTMGFNDSLSHQWMTTEVLVQTLKKYTDETTEIGQKAFKAATEVKTFTQLIDTLKEAMGSGWTESFELIIGDFNEAKELFTMVSDSLGAIITKTDTIRNNLLKIWRANGGRQKLFDSLQSGLDTLTKTYDLSLRTLLGNNYTRAMRLQKNTLEEGKDAIEDYTQAELDAAKAIVQNGSFGTGEARVQALKDMGLEADRVQKLVDKIVSSGWDIKSVEDQIKKSTEEAKEAVESFEDTPLGKIVKNLISSVKTLGIAFKNIIQAGINIGKVFKASLFANVDFVNLSYGALTFSETIRVLSENMLKFTERHKNLKAIRKVLDNLFIFANKSVHYIIDMIITLIGYAKTLAKYLVDGAIKVKEYFFGAEGAISKVTRKISELKNNFYTWLSTLDKNSKLYKALTGILDIISGYKSSFGEGTTALKKFLGMALGGSFDKVKFVFTKIFDVIKGFIQALKDTESPIGKFKGFVGKLWSFVKAVFKFITPIFTYIGQAIDWVLEKIGGADIDHVLSLITQGGLIYLITLLNGFLTNLQVNGLSGTLSNIFGGLGESIGGFLDSFKPDHLKNAAVSIALIAGALFLLSSIKPESLVKALAAMSVLMGLFQNFMDAFLSEDTSMGFKLVKQISSALIKTAAAVVVLALAVKILSSINTGDLIKGMASVLILLNLLAMYLNNTDMDNTGFSTGAGLIMFANSLLILTGVVKLMSMIAFEDIIKGLAGISGILGVIWAFLKYLNSDKIISVSFALNLIANSLLILTGAIKLMSMIDTTDLIKGLFAIAAALTIIAIICNTLPDGMIGQGIGLIAISSALVILSGALKLIGSLPLGTLVKGLLGIGVSLAEIAIALILMKGTLSGAAALVVASMALRILASAVKVMGGVNMGALITSLIGFAATIVVVAIASIALEPVIPMMLAFSAALATLGLAMILISAGIIAFAVASGVLMKSADLIIVAALKIIISLAKYAGMFALLAVQFITNFLTGLLQGLPDILKLAGELILAVLSFIETMVGPVVMKLIDILVALINSLAYAIVEKSDDIMDAITKVMVALGKFIIDALISVLGNIPGLGKLLEGVGDSLDVAFSALVGSSKGEEMMDNVSEGIKKGTPNAAKTANESGSAVKDELAAGFNKDVDLIPYDPDAFEADPKLLEDFTKQMNDKLGIAEDGGAKAGEAEMDSYVSALGDSESDVIDINNLLGQTGADSLINTDGYEDSALSNIGAYNDKFESKFPQTKEEGAIMSEEGAKGADAQSWRYARAAQNVCDTFAATFWKNKQKIYDRGVLIAEACLEGVEDTLEIHSPSRVMMKDGEYTILGFVKGLLNNERIVEASSEDLGNAVVASFTSPLDKIGAILRGEEEFDPTIRPVLDLTNVREGAGEIGGYFSDRSVELASINGRLNADNLAAQRALINTTGQNNKAIVDSLNALRGDVDRLNTTMANTELVMDTGAVVGQLKRPMDGALGRMNVLKGRRN